MQPLLLWVWIALAKLEPSRDPIKLIPLAQEIAAVAEAQELPVPYHYPEARAAILVAIAWHESRFVPNAKSPESDPTCSRGYWQTPCNQPATAETAVKILRYSLKTCGDLTAYVSGQCGKGKQTAALRTSLASKLMQPERTVRNAVGVSR